MQIDVFKQLIGLLVLPVRFLDELPEKLNQLFISVVNAEEEAVEKNHRVRLDVAGVLANALNDLNVEEDPRVHVLLAQSVRLFEAVRNFVVEVDLFAEFVGKEFLGVLHD